MRRLVVIVLVALAGVAVLAPLAGGARPAFSVRMTACHPGLQEADRYMDVTARLRAIPGSVKVAVRFDLRWRPHGETSYRSYPAPGLGVYHRYARGVLYAQQVKGLPTRAAYVMRVHARWYDRHGRVLRTSERSVGPCLQPDVRPDLRVSEVMVAPAKDAAENRYVVAVRNRGRTAAGPFAVQLTFPGAVLSKPVDGLAAGATRFVTFRAAPGCAAGAPTADVDSDDSIDETDESNNSRLVTCPS